MLICNQWFHAVFTRQSSGRKSLFLPDDLGMKLFVTEKHPCYKIYIKKTKIYSIIIILYNSSITDIEHSPNYTAFGLQLTHEVR